MRLAGLIIALGVLALASLNGNPSFFLDVGSIIIVVGITIGCMLSSATSLRLLLRAIFGASLSGQELRAAVRACSRARTYATASGWFGFVMGLIILGAFLDDIRSLGPGISLSLVTIFYSMVLSYLVLLPAQNRLEDRIETT